MKDNVGASADAETGSHRSDEAPSGLRPPGFDPARSWPLIGLICFEVGTLVGVLLQWKIG